MRIARVLLTRHGRSEGERRVVAGTLRNCVAAGVPERFDEPLTRRWVAAISAALDEGGARTFEELLEGHPELGRSDAIQRG